MWINKAHYYTLNGLVESLEARNAEAFKCNVERLRLQTENARLRSDMDWLKLRLNQVERERGQLIQSALGVKIAVPEFVPTYQDPSAALHEMPDLSTVGGDAADQFGDIDNGVDLSLLPGYKAK